jgi:hypothetical protein
MGFYVDLPAIENAIRVRSVQDGVSWSTGEVHWNGGGWVTVWVEGLSEEADPGNTTVYVSGVPHKPELVDSERAQINFRLRPLFHSGKHELRIVHRGAESHELTLVIIGDPPVIRGLEQLP